MRLRLVCTLLVLTFLSGCNSIQPPVGSNPNAKRVYNGTASVGDFLNITIDPVALTLSYTNLTNGQTGTIPYTTTGNGAYTLDDPTGNLISAYEVPGYALLIQAEKAGPNQDTPALITAVESGPISLATFAGNSYNYMQFRTAAGGLEVGSIAIGENKTGQDTSYWPYGALNQNSNPFNNNSMDFSQAQLDPSGTYLSLAVQGDNGADSYIFGTANGFFMVDTPNGAIIGLQKAATAAFNAANAGTYSGMFYHKANASTGQGNVETGTPALYQASVTVSSSGAITITNTTNNNVAAQGTLVPVSSASYLYNGSGSELQDPCNGLFTFRVTTGSTQQDVFVTFVGNAIVFSAFKAPTPWTGGNSTYDYLYGVALD